MKILHTLKPSWFILAAVAAIAVGEWIAWQIARAFDFRFSGFAVAAISVAILAFVVSLIYDGTD